MFHLHILCLGQVSRHLLFSAAINCSLPPGTSSARRTSCRGITSSLIVYVLLYFTLRSVLMYFCQLATHYAVLLRKYHLPYVSSIVLSPPQSPSSPSRLAWLGRSYVRVDHICLPLFKPLLVHLIAPLFLCSFASPISQYRTQVRLGYRGQITPASHYLQSGNLSSRKTTCSIYPALRRL